MGLGCLLETSLSITCSDGEVSIAEEMHDRNTTSKLLFLVLSVHIAHCREKK